MNYVNKQKKSFLAFFEKKKFKVFIKDSLFLVKTK